MYIRALFALALGLGAALGTLAGSVPGAHAFDGATDGRGQERPRRNDDLGIPGLPPVQMPRGVPAFGPDGPLNGLRGGQVEHFDRPGSARPPSGRQDKKPTEADKAEALRRALAPKPSVAAIRQQTLDQLFKQLAVAEDDDTA